MALPVSPSRAALALIGLGGALSGCEALPTLFEHSGAGEIVATGLRGTYFNDAALGEPRTQQIDQAVDFNWGEAPAFSARWMGELVPRSDEVHWLMLAFSGRVAAVGRRNALPRRVERRLDASAGGAGAADRRSRRGALKLEYAHESGTAQLSLAWEAGALPREVISGLSLRPQRQGGGLRAEYLQHGLRARGGDVRAER